MEKLNSSIRLSAMIPVLEGLSDAAFIDDSSGICLWCNSACEEYYVENREEIFGKTVDELVTQGVFTQSVTKEVLNTKSEMTIIHENKNGRHFMTSGYPIFDEEDNIKYVITTSRDITKLKSRNKRMNILSSKLLDVTQLNSLPMPEDNLVAASQPMQNVITLTKRLASVESPVLIKGESGVGKGLIAKTLHEQSNRSDGPFITVNCDAIPDTLIETELFGYVRGTFTGTRAEGKVGLIESANGGTVFLDEISELPLNMQVKLMRLLREHVINRVGSINNVSVDVRIIAATNKKLMPLVQSGRFRDDLYYALNVAPIEVPPLRERPEDILPLIKMNLRKLNSDLGENKILSTDALTILLKYKWPGNIRELMNIIERLILTTTDQLIDVSNMPSFLVEQAETDNNINTDMSLQAAMDKAEKEVLSNALKTYKSTRAIAKVLEVSQPTIVRKLNKHRLTIPKND